jgi:membrane protease YdiL (CAAX protease family)
MLSDKPWKLDALLRLGMSVFVCLYSGSLLATALHVLQTGGGGTKFYSLFAVALVALVGTLLLVRQPWRLETFQRQITLLLVLFYAGILVGAWAQKTAGPAPKSTTAGQMLIITLSFQGAALVLIALFLREHAMSWREAFGFGNYWQRALLLGIIVGCLFFPIGTRLQNLSALALERLSSSRIKAEEQQAVQTLRIASSWRDRLVLGGVTIVLVPVAEEMLFRGILYAWLKRLRFPQLALWGTSLVFAIVHLNLAIFLPLLVLALCLALLYEFTDNLLAPIMAHSCFNALNFAMLYLLQKQGG